MTFKAGIAGLAVAVAIGLAACGDDEEEPTTSGATGATGLAGATGEQGSQPTGDFATVAGNLEDAGFDVTEETGDDLEQRAGLAKPITAEAGVVAAKDGQGDVLVYEFASPEDAEAYAKANDDDVVHTEVEGAIAVTGTASNTDLIDEATAAAFG